MEKKYIISKNGQTVSNITRAGNVTILDASAGIAYTEPEHQFNAFIDDLKAAGYRVTVKS